MSDSFPGSLRRWLGCWVGVALTLGGPVSSAPAAGTTYGVFRSTDRGQTWTRSDSGLPAHSRINALAVLETVSIAGTDSGIYRSVDSGRRWVPVDDAKGASNRVLCLAVLGTRLYAGTETDGLLQSTDRGRTWLPVDGVPARRIRCLLVHRGELHVGTDSQGVLASENGVTRWVWRSTGLPDGAQIFSLAAVGDEVYAGLYRHGLVRWNSVESRWQSVGAVKPLAMASVGDRLAIGHNPGGLHWTSDGGLRWRPGELLKPRDQFGIGSVSFDDSDRFREVPIWEMGSGDGMLLAGAAGSVVQSLDGGQTWAVVGGGLPGSGAGISFWIRDGLMLVAVSMPAGSL